MRVIFIIGGIQAIVFFLLLLNKKPKSFSDKILSVWFLIMALHLILIYILSPEFLTLFPHFLGTHVGFPLLHGPFLFFYVNSLVVSRNQFRLIDWAHFTPFVIVIIVLFPFFSQSAAEKLDILNGAQTYRDKYISILILQICSGPAYIIWVLMLLKKHRISIGNHFSYTEKIELKWLNHITIGLLLIWMTVILSYLIGELLSIGLPIEREYFIYTAFTAFIFVIGYKGLKQGLIFQITPQINTEEKASLPNIEVKNQTHREEIGEEEIQRIIKQLKMYMKNERPYLDERLMLSDIASHLNIPHYRLTKIFNENLKASFFHYINSYRIEAFKKKLANPINNTYTIIALAYDCGFSSKASFNRIFKKLTNQTPSEYKSSLEIKN